jgi:DivIVA domain-containing protein
MTLSLDDVRNKRFRMARKSGYEVIEVDEFVDEVEETFAQLFEENQNLKRQVESLKSAPPAPAAATPPSMPAQQPRPAPAVPPPSSGPIVVTTGKDASAAVVRLVELSTEQAERLVNEATEDANRIREEANRIAHQVTTDARTRAERVESEARVNAERLQADAQTRIQRIEKEIESRRGEMFGDLQKQREDLTKTVVALRTFEANYRRNLTNHIRSQIETLETVRLEPADAPEVIRSAGPEQGSSNKNGVPLREGAPRDDTPTMGGGQATETPRLDALLGDQR